MESGKVMKYLSILILFGIVTVANGQSEELLVFTQTEDTFFKSEILEELKDLAQTEGIPVREIDLLSGAPEELTTSPAIVYQSARGRVLYSGRYAETQTLKNFLRTARVAVQKPGDFSKAQTLYAQIGRAKVVMPVKITALKGEASADHPDLEKQILTWVQQGMQQFAMGDRVQYGRTDRAFYLDLHPYINATGTLFLGVEIYSQFSCIEPVFSALDTPVSGKANDLSAWLPQLGKQMEEQVLKQLQESKIGDAYHPISSGVPVRSWEELGLDLPEGSADAPFRVPSEGAIGADWVFGGPIDNRIPALQFQFQEPLERYSGEVAEIAGSMEFNSGQITKGYFEVEVNSLTMGMESLDQKVLKSYLKSRKFPKASFQFVDIPPHQELSWGETTNIPMTGKLQLLKGTHEVPCQTQFTPMIDEDDQPVLLVQAQFAVNITDWYGIAGPDGPSPARKTLEFNLNFLLHEK